MENIFGDNIYTYTREQAIEDGVLVDVSETAAEAGFKIPVAITRALFEIINNIPKNSYQDFDGRLWDVLWMGRVAVKNNHNKNTVLYELILTHGRKRYITLKMVISPGDSGEPVLTIMLPEED